jgi:hypothetical protein
MDSAAVVKQLECGPWDTKPTNERQVRPLTQLETVEAQQEAWEMEVGTTPFQPQKIHYYHFLLLDKQFSFL